MEIENFKRKIKILMVKEKTLTDIRIVVRKTKVFILFHYGFSVIIINEVVINGVLNNVIGF